MTVSITDQQQDKSELRLTDEQLAEVRRRRAKPNPNYVPIAEARKRFCSFANAANFESSNSSAK
jgi:hypothetical protein